MAETKDETQVDNTELKEENSSEELVEETEERGIDPSLTGLQLYYEKNKKLINYVGGGLALIIAAVCYYMLVYLPDKEKEASNEIMWAQKWFDADSFKVALNGGLSVFSADGQKTIMGFDQICEEYGMTKVGNLAYYYAGICHLRLGNFEQAIEKLSKYSAKDEIIGPLAVGAIGDANMELGKTEEAIKYYLKASEKRINDFTTPYFLKKASLAYELSGRFKEAVELQDRLMKEFSKTEIGKDAVREKARLVALGGL